MALKIKGGFLLLSCLFLLLVPGCWGGRETDQLGYALSIGIDKGKENIVQVTFQIAMPQALGGIGGGGEKGSNTEIVTVEAASLFGALQLVNAFVSRDITLLHNRAVIFSEELAREGIGKYVNPLIRSREIRRNTIILVARGQAREFVVKNRPLLEKNPSRQLELLLEGQHFTGFIPSSTLNDVIEGLKSPGGSMVTALVAINEGKKPEEHGWSNSEKTRREVAYLAGSLPREGGNASEVIGLAAFRGDKLAGFLNGAQTRYYQMAAGLFESAIITLPDPRYPEEYIVVLEMTQGRQPEIRIDLSGEVPLIEFSQALEGEIMSLQSGVNYESGEEKRELEAFVADFISGEVAKVVRVAQEEFKSDIFDFGNYTRKYFWTWQDWVDYAWLEKFPAAEVRIKTVVRVRRTGLMATTVPTPTHKEGKEENGKYGD